MPEMNMPGYVAAAFMTCTVVASQEARLALTVPQATGKIIKQTSGASGGTLWVLAANGDPSASGDWIRLGDGGNPFDQSLNVADDVAFNSATIGSEYGQFFIGSGAGYGSGSYPAGYDADGGALYSTLGWFNAMVSPQLSAPGDFSYGTPDNLTVGEFTSLTQANWRLNADGVAQLAGMSVGGSAYISGDLSPDHLTAYADHQYGTLGTINVGPNTSLVQGNWYIDHQGSVGFDFIGNGYYSLSIDHASRINSLNSGNTVHNVALVSWGLASGSDGGLSVLGFFGASPTTQPASANQAAVATTTPTLAAYGFTSAQATALLTLTNEMRTVLVNLGLMKGSE
jgi:hypothetical protein